MANTNPTAADVRAWAVEKGLAKPTRGRLSRDAIAAYNKSHKHPFAAAS